MYCTDDRESYTQLIDFDRLIQTKTETWGIENNNGRQRHWFGRFRRKTCIVSRSAEMVELTMFLFAYFHVNNPLSNLTNMSHIT